MKKTFAVLVFCAVTQGALAKGPDCSTISGTVGRLACYDAASPPKPQKPAAAERNAARTTYKDPFAAEDARTSARLKNICRGC